MTVTCYRLANILSLYTGIIYVMTAGLIDAKQLVKICGVGGCRESGFVAQLSDSET